MTLESLETTLKRLLSLGDETRRRIYAFVAGQSGAVSRDDVSRATAVSRPLAAYHLDRLLADGLVSATYQRPQGRTGPGAGRPAKLYARSGAPLEISLPRRDYELLASIMADALSEGGGDDNIEAAARDHGEHLAGRRTVAMDDEANDPSRLIRLLQELGYEPYGDSDGCTRLRNCLFEREAAEHRNLVCGINLAFVKGALAGVSEPAARAFLDPAEGRCCVAIATELPGSDDG
jgi:predicted ArsR family transcriptional regulator